MFMNKIISLHLQIKTVSEANCSEHWSKKNNRHKSQKKSIWWAFKSMGTKIPLPCVIKLTRISPRTLDDDNLSMSLKWIRDSISEHIFPEKTIGRSRKIPGKSVKLAGRADDDERISWQYGQEKGNPQSIRIDIFT